MDQPDNELDLARLDGIAAELGIAKDDHDNRTRILCAIMQCDATRMLTDAIKANTRIMQRAVTKAADDIASVL